MRKSDVSRRVQRAVSDVLTRILLCETDDESLISEIKSICDDYMLKEDPVTGLPCSVYDYNRKKFEIDIATLED